VCFIDHKTTSELECMILSSLYLAGVKNTYSWYPRKGGLKRVFTFDIPMVPSSTLTVSTDGERLTCGGFSLREIVYFGSLEFIIDCFGSLSLSPRRSDSDTTIMGSTRSGP
jgi:hypothetical protein